MGSQAPSFTRLATGLGVTALLLTACGGGEPADTPTDDTTTAPDTGAATTDAEPTTGGTATAATPTATGSPTGATGTAGAPADLPESVSIGFADERPYGYLDENGEPAGQAPAVAAAVLGELGVEISDATVVEFGALINGLNADRFDLIAAGMFINEERASQALFTDPDYCGTTAFGVVEGNPHGLTDFASIADTDAILGVMNGAVEDQYAVGAGVPDGQIQRFTDTATMVDALTLNQSIDAFALTTATVQAQLADVAGFEVTQGFIPVLDGEEQLGCGGYVFRFEDIAFRDAFNQVLNEMKEAGELLPLVEEYGFTNAELDPAVGLTVEDLIGQPYDFAAP